MTSDTCVAMSVELGNIGEFAVDALAERAERRDDRPSVGEGFPGQLRGSFFGCGERRGKYEFSHDRRIRKTILAHRVADRLPGGSFLAGQFAHDFDRRVECHGQLVVNFFDRDVMHDIAEMIDEAREPRRFRQDR